MGDVDEAEEQDKKQTFGDDDDELVSRTKIAHRLQCALIRK